MSSISSFVCLIQWVVRMSNQMYGFEFKYLNNLSLFEKIYIKLLGIPILGLRIRLWHMLPIIKKYSQSKRNILDFGSGRGAFTLELARDNPSCNVLGIDLDNDKVLSANYVAKAAEIKNCSFVVMDIFNIPEDTTFDLIVAIDVLEHIHDDLGILMQLNKCLDEKGVLIIHVPHFSRNLFGMSRTNFDIEGHVRPGYTINDMYEIFNKSRFDIIDFGYTYNSIETLVNDLSYLITKGSEKNKILYALFFPFFLLVGWLFHGKPKNVGSGLYIIGKKNEN